MSYQCPKGHMSTDSDYCSECGAKIGQTPVSSSGNSSSVKSTGSSNSLEICPDCGTQRVGNDRFCEVCRHDFVGGSTGTAEKVVAEKQPTIVFQPVAIQQPVATKQPAEVAALQEAQPVAKSSSTSVNNTLDKTTTAATSSGLNTVSKNELVIAEKLNIAISVDKNRLAQNSVESSIKPDSMDRIFPLDLDENLVGRRSKDKGIYPEIEINDPGVSHRQLKFIKQADGAFAVLELGSANGTEFNGVQLEAGINTAIKAGDEFAIGLWTTLKVVTR